MPSALDHALNSPQTAIGKGTVGEPTPAPPGKEGVLLKVAVFFDGTMNNRTNTKVRLDRNDKIKDGSEKDKILDKKAKNMLSSYANYYSNVAILELLNKQRKAKSHEVSVYVEGIGTVNYEEGGPSKDKHGNDAVDKQGNKIIPTQDAEISNDQQGGFAFGTGFTGIVDRVTQGIRKAKEDIWKAYNPKKQYIKQITINVIGFSRGAAAARHFVSRHKDFRGIWPNQPAPPELVVNFVGLYETVSSYDKSDSVAANGAKDIVLGKLFSKNVGELQLALGGVPKRVIHLTAQDEMRHNFSLTTIDSSLQVKQGKAFQISLPGVHSDIGGGYVEVDPDNEDMDPTKTYANQPSRPAIRALNLEERQMVNRAEKRQLVEEGWYTDGTNGTPDQFKPVDPYDYAYFQRREDHREAAAKHDGRPFQRSPYTGEQYGSRYLTNGYQYVTLYLMMQMAQNGLKPGTHTPMVFKPLTSENGIYDVPADLVAVRDHFEGYIQAIAADDTPENRLGFPSIEQGKKTCNKYLHRSSRLFKESTGSYENFTTWVAYKRAANDMRVVYSDVGDSATGHPVKVPDLGKEAPTGADTPAATGTPAAGEGPNGNGVSDQNNAPAVTTAPIGAEIPEATGTFELNETP